MSWTGENWGPEELRFVTDLTGDGRADIVGFGRDGVWTAVNKGGSTFSQPHMALTSFNSQGWHRGQHLRLVVDLTGDGKADIIGFGDNDVGIALSNGDGTFAQDKSVLTEFIVSKGWRVDQHPRFVVDITGNGKADIVGFWNDGVWTALGNGDGTFQAPRLVLEAFNVNQGWRVDQHPRFVVDLTGDGKADLVGFGNDGVWTALSNGDGTFQAPKLVLPEFGINQGWRVEQHLRLLADLTGDGKADIMAFGNEAGPRIALGNGDGTFQPAQLVREDSGKPQRLHPETWDFGQSAVSLFSEGQFSGSFIPLDEGHTRFASEFNDATSSVRVAPGYGVILYEHANEFGGYGAWIDLLEDCPDLSVYDFDKKTSYVQVFRSERDAFIWARTAIRDGHLVSGHWERRRASGVSPNSPVAVVAPPVPPRTTPLPPQEGIIVRDHRGEPRWFPPPVTGNPGDGVIRDHRTSQIKHVFVLMLENRAFDHMLGFSGITGTDAATGQPTTINGLSGSEFNAYNGVNYSVQRGAPDRAPHDPPHGFPGVLQQLCGEGAVYESGAPYPPIHNSGFASAYAKSHPESPDSPMRCFTPDQVPVLTALAREFVVCDHWFSSMPGPTEPNRWFVHAATAGFFDEAPSYREYIEAFSSPWSGIAFAQGTIFDRLSDAGLKHRIYACDSFPNVAMLKGISRTFDVEDFEDFATDVASSSYDAAYTFIEPSYDALSDFSDGNSQHPLGSVHAGELLIKQTYEALRKSPIWENSMLIVTYDEHGGFYDHMAPPAATPTGSKGRKYGFTFDRLGPRVPAVIISPRIPRNLIDHRRYEHSTVVSTVTRLFNLKELTVRSSMTSDLKSLATLGVPRVDAPLTLPDPMGGAAARISATPFEMSVVGQPDRPLDDDPTRRVAATIASGLAQHLEIAPASEHTAIIARVNALRTHGEALEYLKEVHGLVKSARQRARVQRSMGVPVH